MSHCLRCGADHEAEMMAIRALEGAHEAETAAWLAENAGGVEMESEKVLEPQQVWIVTNHAGVYGVYLFEADAKAAAWDAQDLTWEVEQWPVPVN